MKQHQADIVTSHKQFCGAFLITSCDIIASIICHRTVIDEQNSLVTFVLKNVPVWTGMQQRPVSKTSGPSFFFFFFNVESDVGIFRGKNSGVYTVLGKLSLEAISKFQQSCHRLQAKKELWCRITMSWFCLVPRSQVWVI